MNKGSSIGRAHQSAQRQKKKDELSKERSKPCERCGSTTKDGKIKVFGAKGTVVERPCPVCNFK